MPRAATRFAWAALDCIVSIRFVSTGVTWYLAIASRSSKFLKTPRSRRYFNYRFRHWRTEDRDNSLSVMSSTHLTRRSSFSAVAISPCLQRFCIAKTLIDLHLFSSSQPLHPEERLPVQLLLSCLYPVRCLGIFCFHNLSEFSNSDIIHNDVLGICMCANFSKSFFCGTIRHDAFGNFQCFKLSQIAQFGRHPLRCSQSVLIRSAARLLFVTILSPSRCISAVHDVSLLSCSSDSSLFVESNRKTTTAHQFFSQPTSWVIPPTQTPGCGKMRVVQVPAICFVQ